MPLVIRLDSELDAGLRALSVEERIPRVEVVRKLIRERLAHPPRSVAWFKEQRGFTQ
jgi:hypothetical protein